MSKEVPCVAARALTRPSIHLREIPCIRYAERSLSRVDIATCQQQSLTGAGIASSQQPGSNGREGPMATLRVPNKQFATCHTKT